MPKRQTKKSKNKNPMQTVFTRYMLIIAIFILWIGAIGVRLVHLQVNQSEWLRGKAQNQRRDIKKSKQLRGTIFEPHGTRSGYERQCQIALCRSCRNRRFGSDGERSRQGSQIKNQGCA